MDKNDVILIVNQCFKNEGFCLALHLMDNTEILVTKQPRFASSCLHVDMEIEYESGTVSETYYIPYRNIVFIVETSHESLKIINEQMKRYMEQYKHIEPVDEEMFL